MDRTTKRDHLEKPMNVGIMAAKILDLSEPKPKPELKPKQPSKRLQQIVTKIGSTFMTLEDSINEALELGRKEGFTDIEIGDMIRVEFKRINRPRMTLARYLPVTAKHMEKARPKSDFGNKMLPNRPVAISTENGTLPSTNTTTPVVVATKSEQQQRPGKWNQGPEEYDINKVDEYALEYSHEIVRYQHRIIQSQRKRIEELEAAMAGKDSEALKSESKPEPKPELKLYEPPTGKMALDKWEVACWMDDKMGHCGLCQKIGEADPNRKQDRDRMFEHYYKRYGKDGYIQEVVRVDDNGKVDLYHICGGAYSLSGLPPDKLETTELKPRQNYWKTHAAPMDKIEQARKRAEEWKKEREEYEDKKSKLSSEERKTLAEYETNMLLSGAKSLLKKGR